ncbi:MAG: protein kinase [Alphaproteobacteria bacterium]|nr:protein kinase [Alphaproteobacteria bacterium]
MIELRTGDEIGSWRVDNVLTFGEPALVSAHHTRKDGVQATLKVSRKTPGTEIRQRREVRALQSFDHPGIPKLIESGEDGEYVYIAMRPFSCDSLSDRIVAGRVGWKQACVWLYEVAAALQHVHQSGWVHRDLTPQNIYVGARPRDVWMLGFEGALLQEERGGMDHTFRGNMSYLAPECLADPEYHAARADLYAFGLVAYEVLTGEPAFPAAAWAEKADRERSLLQWKTRARAMDPGDGQPEWLRSLVRKCTHPDHTQRLPDMDAVVAWLDAARLSWEEPEEPIRATPMHVPRERLPPLSLQPTMIDAAEIARMIRQQQALEAPPPNRLLHVLTASAMGVAAGLALSTLIVLYVELSRLG